MVVICTRMTLGDSNQRQNSAGLLAFSTRAFSSSVCAACTAPACQQLAAVRHPGAFFGVSTNSPRLDSRPSESATFERQTKNICEELVCLVRRGNAIKVSERPEIWAADEDLS